MSDAIFRAAMVFFLCGVGGSLVIGGVNMIIMALKMGIDQ